ncbi:TPA: hypothetical protein O4I73_003785, partial [Vibrio parahaemolyticus]|nr:hypothetical protein [Vibrio parahaemolyticus]
LEAPHGLFFGRYDKDGTRVRMFVYHLYLDFCSSLGFVKPLSVQRLSSAIKLSAKDFGGEYKTRLIKGRTQTNIRATEELTSILTE